MSVPSRRRARRTQPTTSTFSESTADKGQIAALADGNGPSVARPGFPQFSKLPAEIATRVWELVALDYKTEPQWLQIDAFTDMYDLLMGGEPVQGPLSIVQHRGASVLRQVCFDSRRVFDAMAAGAPVASFHCWPLVLHCSARGPWPVDEVYVFPDAAASFGVFVNPYEVYANPYVQSAYERPEDWMRWDFFSEGQAGMYTHYYMQADILYMPLSVLRNPVHQLRRPHARRPTYILAGDFAYQVPDLGFFFQWRSRPSVALSDDGTVEEVVREPWPASADSLNMRVLFGEETMTDWTAAVRVDRTPAGEWKTKPQLPACWGLEFDYQTAWAAMRWEHLFPAGALEHIVFVVERLPRSAERQGPHDLARFRKAPEQIPDADVVPRWISRNEVPVEDEYGVD